MFVKIYFADVSCLEDGSLFEKYLSQASVERRERIFRLRFGRDRRLSLGAASLLSRVLAEAGIEEGAAIAYGEHRKPYLKDHPEVRFNLSHSGTLVMCAVSDSDVGCDVQTVGEAPLRIAKRFFSEEERERLFGVPETERDGEFCRIWTLKESYLKATGRGFTSPAGEFSVVDRKGRTALRQSADTFRYTLREVFAADGYRAAYCVRGTYRGRAKIVRADFENDA